MPRNRSMVSSLFIRNVPADARSDELREIFSKYGPVTDVYIPLDYYTRQHRGFAYVQYPLLRSFWIRIFCGLVSLTWHTFEDYRDADDALYYLKGFKYCGVELEIEFARSDRKTPHMMRMREKGSGGGRNDDYDDYDRRRRGGARRSFSRSPRRDR
ncbi:hypothetical protein HELRODRAFT_181891 [Helobdella robusta]|uniref:RRM domain-containing protein n=1 Tax=Helobdella robusta TaxID=6412 RepID=T1FHF8_HELRO|nr:hypothetical protein HELRODRAFT_181891 [Helobdella robusta]ESN91968.1 hypothetical protein HELRODRAFT_181891 [Helobdella robusta]